MLRKGLGKELKGIYFGGTKPKERKSVALKKKEKGGLMNG